MISFVIGRILLTEAALMVVPLLVAVSYGENTYFAFIIPIIALAILGAIFGIKAPHHHTLYARDGLAIVAIAWITLSLFGALPFFISGEIPNYIDAFFETVSGFTTTGSSILQEVEKLSQGLMFWRSFTHWVGGMGVLVFIMAVIPMTSSNGMHVMRAEVPGPSVGKLVSRISDTAKILYGIYLVMTVLEIVILQLFGMSLFDACINSFGSAGTGGFSNKNLSVGAYNNPAFELIIGIFMLLFGINFNMYYFLLIGKIREILHSEELRAYLGIIAASTVIIAIDINTIYNSISGSLRYSFFQVSSIITTTGFSSVDFNAWPTLSKVILVMLMFVGASAGSTGGGIKVARIVILIKTAFADMKKMIYPNAMPTVRFEGKPINERGIRSVHLFLTVYIMIFVTSVFILSFDGYDLITTFTAVASCMNNIGPGLGVVGPMGNFGGFSNFSTIVLSFDMLAGRLEIFPMVVLFAPSLWKNGRFIKKLPIGD